MDTLQCSVNVGGPVLGYNVGSILCYQIILLSLIFDLVVRNPQTVYQYFFNSIVNQASW